MKTNTINNLAPIIRVKPIAKLMYIGGEEEAILSKSVGTSAPQAQQFLEKRGIT